MNEHLGSGAAGTPVRALRGYDYPYSGARGDGGLGSSARDAYGGGAYDKPYYQDDFGYRGYGRDFGGDDGQPTRDSPLAMGL